MKLTLHPKDLVAAVWPIGEVVAAVWSDQTIDSTELKEIGIATGFALAVFLTPAKGVHSPERSGTRPRSELPEKPV